MRIFNRIFSCFIAMVLLLSAAPYSEAAETTPFKNHILPCIVGAVDFDNGGENVSYGKISNVTSNFVYRDDARLNIYDGTHGVHVGTNVGAWYVYTINVPQSGIYSVSIKGASTGLCSSSLTFDETEYNFTIPSSGSFQIPTTTKVLELELEKGVHTLKYTHYAGGLNFYSITFDYLGEKNKINLADKTGSYRNFYLPTIIEAEEFDYIGNHSRDNVNSLGKFREDAVLDIGEISEDEYYLFCEKDEYALYTFSVENEGAYSFDAKICKDSQVTVFIDDVKIASKVDISLSEDIKNLRNVWLPKGIHKMKVLCENASFSIDYFRITKTKLDYVTLENAADEPVTDSTSQIYKNIYVSTEGEDGNSGEKDSPFKSISRAVDEVKKHNKSMTGDIVVHIEGGNYLISKKLVIDESASGYNGHKVIFKGESLLNPPVINGGTEITNWKKQENSPIWVADADNVEETRTLYINGIPAKLAKSKYEYRASSAYVVEGSDFANDGLVVSKTNFPKSFEHPEDLMLGWNVVWVCQRTPVKTVIDNGKEMTFVMEQPGWNVNGFHGVQSLLVGSDKEFFIENALELLDEPGEFFFDKYEKKMYYYPFSAEDMLTAKTYCGTTEQLLYLGNADTTKKLSNVELNNISFKYGALNSVSKTGTYFNQTDDLRIPNEVGNWYKETVFPAQVTVNNADNVSIRNCTFSSLGSNALNLDNGVTNTEVVGNKFTDISGTAIVAGSFLHTKTLPEDQARCSDIDISNNVIRRSAQEFIGLTAISVYYADNINVSHNDIKDVPYSGIVVGWGWGDDLRETGSNISVTHNRIESTNSIVNDGAHIYTLGKLPGSDISDNYLIQSGDHRGGIYFDEGSEDFVVRNNVVTRSYQWLFAREGAKLKNLYCENNYTDNDNFTQDKENVTVINTTVVKDGNWPKEAVSIMNNAGVEPQFERLLNDVEFPEWRLQNIEYHPLETFNSGILPNSWVLGRDYTNFHEISADKPDVYAGGEIGDTRPGEWVEFEVDIPKSDKYQFEIRGGDGWKPTDPECYAVALVDGEVVSEHTTIPRNAWKLIDIPIGEIYLEEGKHTVRLCVEGNDWLVGGFKLDNGELVADSEGYDEGLIVSEKEIMEKSIGFLDVAGHWAEYEIRNLAENGIISGYDKYTFGPEDSLTLYQACMLALRTVENYDGDSWKNKAAELGLMETAYELDYVITRERFCDVIMKAYKSVFGKYAITVTDSNYADLLDIDSSYLYSVYGARELSLMVGYPDGSFMPKKSLTRAEAAKVIHKMRELLE